MPEFCTDMNCLSIRMLKEERKTIKETKLNPRIWSLSVNIILLLSQASSCSTPFNQTVKVLSQPFLSNCRVLLPPFSKLFNFKLYFHHSDKLFKPLSPQLKLLHATPVCDNLCWTGEGKPCCIECRGVFCHHGDIFPVKLKTAKTNKTQSTITTCICFFASVNSVMFL